jgi:hypothetical protein
MRMGECVDLAFDCLHATAPDQWAVHVPLGKLKTERMVPVDSWVVTLIQRLRFFRSLDPLPPDGRLLARPSSRQALFRQLRDYLHADSGEDDHRFRFDPDHLFRGQADHPRSEATLAQL